MRKIFAIAWKDTLIAFSSATQWVFFIILPLVFTFILGGGFAGSGVRPDDRVRLIVVNEANTPTAQQLLDALAPVTAVHTDVLLRADADAELAANRAAAVLVIPHSFDPAAASGASLQFKQRPNNLDAPIAERAVEAAAQHVGSPVAAARMAVAEAERIRPFADDAARQAYFDKALASAQTLVSNAPKRLDVTRPTTTPYRYNQAVNTSAGQLLTWVFIPLLSISALFAYERRNGTMRHLLTTPASRAQLLLGTLVGQFLTALVQMALLVGFGIIVMHLNWGQQPVALAVLLIPFALSGVALGTMLGTFIKSESQANGLSIMLGMVMALLGGCWYPLEIFPEGVRAAVHVLPTTWAMQGLIDIAGRGLGPAAVLPNAIVLLGFAAVFFVVGALRFRFE